MLHCFHKCSGSPFVVVRYLCQLRKSESRPTRHLRKFSGVDFGRFWIADTWGTFFLLNFVLQSTAQQIPL